MKKSDAELYKLMCMKMSSVFEKFEEVNNFCNIYEQFC